MRALRIIAGVVVGIVVANLCVYGWEMLLLPLLPFGRAIDPVEFQQADFVATVPFAAKAWVAAGWALCSFLGALAAFRLARWDFAGWIVAAVVAALCIVNVVVLPHPLWMQLWAVTGPFVGALFAFGLWRRSKAADWRAAQTR